MMTVSDGAPYNQAKLAWKPSEGKCRGSCWQPQLRFLRRMVNSLPTHGVTAIGWKLARLLGSLHCEALGISLMAVRYHSPGVVDWPSRCWGAWLERDDQIEKLTEPSSSWWHYLTFQEWAAVNSISGEEGVGIHSSWLKLRGSEWYTSEKNDVAASIPDAGTPWPWLPSRTSLVHCLTPLPRSLHPSC